jgi:biopolymer transport protein ExbD
VMQACGRARIDRIVLVSRRGETEIRLPEDRPMIKTPPPEKVDLIVRLRLDPGGGAAIVEYRGRAVGQGDSALEELERRLRKDRELVAPGTGRVTLAADGRTPYRVVVLAVDAALAAGWKDIRFRGSPPRVKTLVLRLARGPDGTRLTIGLIGEAMSVTQPLEDGLGTLRTRILELRKKGFDPTATLESERDVPHADSIRVLDVLTREAMLMNVTFTGPPGPRIVR